MDFFLNKYGNLCLICWKTFFCIKEPESPPQDVEVLNVTATEISLKWLPPEKPNGIITHYEVLYGSVNAFGCKNTTTTSLLLNGLKPYTLYNISVRAFTHLGHGNQLSTPLSVRTAETGRCRILDCYLYMAVILSIVTEKHVEISSTHPSTILGWFTK